MTGPRWPGALRVPAFRRLFTALLLSSFGDWLGFLATTALAVQLVDGFAGQAYATGAVLVLRLLPAIALAPVAGAIADRFDRKRTMVATNVVRAVVLGSIPVVAVAAPDAALVWLLVATLLVEAAALFWTPAKEATVPNLVPGQLESANQLSLVATYGTAPLAAAVFGVLGAAAAKTGAEATYVALYANAATFAFAAVQVARLQVPAGGERAADPPSIAQSIREGLAFAGSTPLVRGLLTGMLGALAAGGAVIALGRLFAESVLAGGDGAYGLLFGAVFVGIASGVALGPRLLGDFSRRRAVALSIVSAGAALVFLSLVPNLALAVVAVLVVGAFAGVAYVVGLTLLGEGVSDDLRGRTFALVTTLMRIDLLLVTATTPFIAGAIGVRTIQLGSTEVSVNGVSVVLLVGGLLAVLLGLVSYRQLDDRPGVSLLSDLALLVQRRPPVAQHPGLLVAVEGGEGAGKSTQVAMLADWLRVLGHEVVVTREPGATDVGARVRALLLDPASALSPRAEALLYAADRAQHVDTVVRPALERGAVVVTDRFVDSSLAYQGAGRALSVDEVREVSQWATGGVRPGLVLLLDVDPAVGLARAGDTGAPDRIEQESLAFHRRVRQGFLDLAARAPERYLVVDAALPADVVTGQVRERLLTVLPPLPARVDA